MGRLAPTDINTQRLYEAQTSTIPYTYRYMPQQLAVTQPLESESSMPVRIEKPLTKEQLKQQLLNLFVQEEELKLSDIVERYHINLELAMEVLLELEKDGKIRAKT